MNIVEVTAQSKKRAEKIAKENGGFLVPVYAVVTTDTDGRVMAVTHDHLKNLHSIKA